MVDERGRTETRADTHNELVRAVWFHEPMRLHGTLTTLTGRRSEARCGVRVGVRLAARINGEIHLLLPHAHGG